VEGPIRRTGIIGDAKNNQVQVIVDFTSCKNNKGRAVIDDDIDIFEAIDGDECVIEIVFRCRSVRLTISLGNERCHQNLRVIK
jgi:hypothetical protein